MDEFVLGDVVYSGAAATLIGALDFDELIPGIAFSRSVAPT